MATTTALHWADPEFRMACLLRHSDMIAGRMAELGRRFGSGAALLFRNACINAFSELDETACHDSQAAMIDREFRRMEKGGSAAAMILASKQ